MANNPPLPNLSKTLQVGIVAGFIATSVGNFLGIVTQSIAGQYYPETSVGAVTLSAMSMAIVGAIVYYLLYQQAGRFARDIFTMMGLTVPTVITLFVLSGFYDAAFRVIAVSVAYAVSMSVVIIVPWLADKYKILERPSHSSHSKNRKHGRS
ncbi:MAG: hypothetical protein N2691_00075 [Patescibacteria group bacterium]|nr:hypothetical protein [Patescibacteria group bacterium]